MRLDRFLSEESELTRSEAKKRIRDGQVSVNGDSRVRPEMKVHPESDEVRLSGQRVRQAGMVYLMMNKPRGVLSATEDRRAKTVLDLVDAPYRKKLFPVGRLDRDTEGLLLLTNDGMLAHNLLSPKKHVGKVYFAVVDGEVTPEDEEAFRRGMDIGEKNPTLPSFMRRLSVDGDFLRKMEKGTGPESLKERMRICMRSLTVEDYARCGEGQSLCAVMLTEGKFHQVKRMFEAVGKKVVYLKRISMGPLVLDRNLPAGRFRTLTGGELLALQSYRRQTDEAGGKEGTH